MTARIFISYRSSDGKDKATALARDLAAAFGEEQVFLDKEDLRAGSQWRDEVKQALSARPVVLLLMTPQLLAATDVGGRLRIDAADDPVRLEFCEALAVGAQVIPVLCDGLDTVPQAAQLPAPFDRIGERTWRRLRAYDWQGDVQRLVQDLHDLGVVPRAAVAVPALPPGPRRRVLLGAVMAVAIGVGLAVLLRPRAPPPSNVAGEWDVSVAGQASWRVVLRQEGDRLVLASLPVAIAGRAEWAEYRGFWRERTGSALDHVAYRGEGALRAEPGTAPAVDVGFEVVGLPAETIIDRGQLEAALNADGTQLTGRLWLNSEQAERSVLLQRKP